MQNKANIGMLAIERALKLQESAEEKTIREATLLLIGKNGGDLAKTVKDLAVWLAKQRDAHLSESDWDNARKLVQEVSTGSHSGIIATVFGAGGGISNFGNLAVSEKPATYRATPGSSQYPGEGKTVPSDSGYYDSRGTFMPSKDSRQPTGEVGSGSKHPATGPSSKPLSEAVGKMRWVLPRQEEGATQTLQKSVDKDKLEGISAEVNRAGEIVSPTAPLIGSILSSKPEYAVDKIVNAQLKKRREFDLTKSR